MATSKGKIHVVIGDTQVKEGVPLNNLTWIGRYIVDQFGGVPNVRLIHVGDHADMESLSAYDKGKKSMEGRRYKADIKAANHGWDLLNEPIHRFNAKKRVKWNPSREITLGNHEYRIERACEEDAQIDGVISYDDLNFKEHGWRVHDFLKPVTFDGITYCHYFQNPNSGRPYCGENLLLRLKTIGRSFTMGHQQGCNYVHRQVGATRHHGLVIGSSYLHDEKYLGYQGNDYWRGIVVCHQVENGAYDPMFVSLEWLCRRYEKKTLRQFMKQYR